MASRSSSDDGWAKTKKTVAVAVAEGGSRSSQRAVRWAVENLMPLADRFLLIHVTPPLSSIPSPSGNHIPIKEVPSDVAAMYMQDMKLKLEEVFLPFKRLCRAREMETLLLVDDNPSTALLRYISESDITSLVLGSSSANCILRKFKDPDVSSTVLKLSPNNCNIYVVSLNKLKTKLASLSAASAGSSTLSETLLSKQFRQRIIPPKSFSQRELYNIDEQIQILSLESKGNDASEISKPGDFCDISPQSFRNDDSSNYVDGKFQDTLLLSSSRENDFARSHQNSENRASEIQVCNEQDVAGFEDSPFILHSSKQAEVERLRLELHNTLVMYNQACKDLVYARKKVQLLLAEFSDDAKKVKEALEREDMLKKIALEQKTKHLEAIKEVEAARRLLAKEALERQRAEMNAIKELSERKKIVEALISSDKRYRRYSVVEIEAATDCFSEAKKIGEGGYGKVYKCYLHHTPVAVKVLRQDASDRKEEFLKEVEVLSQLRHPHMILLLGACPENGSLVYEYMDNGSLEDQIFCHGDTPPLPWFIRFRIVYEVACGLAFLHGSKPEPIVHRDLKPGNILLDRNYVSKIGDVGLAKLISDVVPDSVTEYRDTVLAGTFYYMDPEYQRTGTIRPKSDLYAFGIIILQLLTAKHPLGLLMTVESAITNSSFEEILDNSVGDWPLAESEKLAMLALKCCTLRSRDRPDLEIEVMPVLEELLYIAEVHCQLQRFIIDAPSHFFCPILQEVMDDPYIAADGFTYEYRAIKAWLSRHSISPVTKLSLLHVHIIPNYSLRSAIREWKAQATFINTIT